jgi:hypothetical protein
VPSMSNTAIARDIPTKVRSSGDSRRLSRGPGCGFAARVIQPIVDSLRLAGNGHTVRHD